MSQATLRDLCAEAVNVDGTGDATFHGALRGHRTFAVAYAGALPLSGVRIKIEEANAQGYIVRWEDSECTVSETGFTRDTCINSSNNGAFVEFGAGYKRAFVFIPVADVGGSGSITAADITDSSATGRAVLIGDAGVGRGVLEVYSEQETLIKINEKFAEVYPMLTPLYAIQAKASCKVATIGNIDINAPLSAIAGIDLFDNERALVWQQTDELENGTYFLIDGYLSRYGRFNNDDLPTFSTLEIQQGAYTGRRFRVTSENAIPGTAPMTWELVGRESLGLGSASLLDVAASGDATAGHVVKGDDSRLANDRTASGLRTATTIVSVSAATAPSAGQTLVATSSTAATWQTPASGGISIGDSVAGGNAYSVLILDAIGNLTQDSASLKYIGGVLVCENFSTPNSLSANSIRCTSVSFASGATYFTELAFNRFRMGSSSPDFNDAALELGAVRKKPYTVGTLPVAPSAYDQCLVVDALAPAIGSAVVGGGGVAVNVIWISPNWMVI